MKKSILALAAYVVVAGTVLTSCSSSAEKVENAENKVMEANENLSKANEEYLADVEKYRIQTEEKIAANNQSIADFNAKIANEKKEAKEDYQKRIAELELKNSNMKKKMDEYKADGMENWENFKSEFNHDMEELAKAFSDLMKNNVK